MKRYINPRNDMTPANRELINRVWNALTAHVERTSHIEGSDKRREALADLGVATNSLLHSDLPLKDLPAFAAGDLGPVVASWPLFAFKQGIEWLQERRLKAGFEEGDSAPSIVSTLKHFEHVRQDDLVLSLPAGSATDRVHEMVKYALKERGWTGTWSGKLVERVDKMTEIVLTPPYANYGTDTVNLRSYFVHVTQAELGIAEPFDRWYCISELKPELTAEIVRRCDEAQRLVIQGADLFRSAAAIRNYIGSELDSLNKS